MIIFKIGFFACLIELILLFIKPKWATFGRELPNRKKSIRNLTKVIIILLLLSIFTSKHNSTTVTQPTTDNKAENVSIQEGKEPSIDTTKKEEDNKIKQGTYKIGKDIPAGDYLVISNGMGYIQCMKDSTGKTESIIFNDVLSNRATSYVTLNEGEYFKLTDAEMYPVDKAPSIIPSDGLYKDGMYKVGSDIPAGEYKVKYIDSMGYTEIDKNCLHKSDSILSNDVVKADTYITVENGQYLKLKGVQITK
jgi:hypothetical protein